MRSSLLVFFAATVVAVLGCAGKSHDERPEPHIAGQAGDGGRGAAAGSGGSALGRGGAVSAGGSSGHDASSATGGTGDASVGISEGGTGVIGVGASTGGNAGTTGGAPGAGATSWTSDSGMAGSAAGAGGASTGGVSAGGVSAGGNGDSDSGVGQAGEPGCHTVFENDCDCNWGAGDCKASDTIPYLGKECPPTLDEAWLDTNWNLPKGQTGAIYDECSDGATAGGVGTRYFSFRACGHTYSFGFDRSGHLVGWFNDSVICGGRACDSETPTTSVCSSCPMTSDPGAPGSSCITNKPNNGFSPDCMADTNGRWLMTPSCND